MSRVKGTVRDLERGTELAGASVTLPGLGLARGTDTDGRFIFEDIPPGEHAMRVEFLGYSNREEVLAVEAGKIITLDFRLAVEPIQLEPIEVSVEARELDLEISGFYQRREATSGLFITREKIEDRAPLYTTDLFHGLAGVRVVGGLGMGTQQAVVLTGSRSLSLLKVDPYSQPCYPTVWMDGQMVHKGGDIPAFVDNLIHTQEIAGIEVYNSAASVPHQYNLFAQCGVIVFWTRHGG